MAARKDIEEIQELLQHEYIRERKKGIERASQLLAEGMYREELRAMLEKTAKGDLMTGVAQLAQQALDEDDRRHEHYPPRYESKGNQHIVGMVCRNGHPNYFDKHIICSGTDRYRTTDVPRGELDEIIVKCQTCGEEMKIEVDCEGYK